MINSLSQQTRLSVPVMYLLIYSLFHNGPVIGTKQHITDRAIARSVMMCSPANRYIMKSAIY